MRAHLHRANEGVSLPSQDSLDDIDMRSESPSPEQAPMPLVPVPVDRVRYYAAARDPKVSRHWVQS